MLIGRVRCHIIERHYTIFMNIILIIIMKINILINIACGMINLYYATCKYDLQNETCVRFLQRKVIMLGPSHLNSFGGYRPRYLSILTTEVHGAGQLVTYLF